MIKNYRKKMTSFSVEELENEIQRHNELYFKHAAPEIRDEDFDLLVERLRGLNPDSKVLQKVGSDLGTRRPKVEHSSPMLSLDKCYQLEDLEHWAKKFAGDALVTPKIDGLAIAIHYDEHGKLFLAETRGDGWKGEDITENVRYVAEIPHKISGNHLEVRGEVYMRKSIFKRYDEGFANPRNLAAGALKQKSASKTAEYELSFFAYELIGASEPKESEKFARLRKLGFVALEARVVATNSEDLQNAYEDFLARRDSFDYELDGVVYKANEVAEQVRLGASAHHPRWAIAYKFQGDSGVSILREVEWSVSRTGAITPIGLIDPVKLSGATVSRVSLHNVGLMQKLGLGIGAKVLVMRRGGVIPNLEKVLEPGSAPVALPKICPSCGAEAELRDDFLYCTNSKSCRKTKLGELRHFIHALEIEGLGPKLIGQLYDAGLVEELPDFFTLQKGDLLGLERVGEILADKLLENLKSRRPISLALFLRSLGIPELAKHSSEVLVKNFRNLKNIFEASSEQLAAIPSIGPVISENVVQGLREKRPLIEKLLLYLPIEEKTTAAQGRLSGKSFLFTGKLDAMERSAAEKKVVDEGGEVAASVQKNLDYLVVGREAYQNAEKGNKWMKAESLIQKGAALKVISEDDFLALLAH